MKNYIFVLLVLITATVFAQGTSGTSAKYEYRSLIDLPTAGILTKGVSALSFDVLPYGSVVAKIEVGVFDGIHFGISYGGGNIIGTGKVNWYKYPGVNFRARILDEEEALPALTIGFDSQGKGMFYEELNRFEIKSPGFFVATSKNFDILGYLSLHAVVNYSLEREDNDKDLNLGLGFEKTIGTMFSFVAEYNVAFNDNTGLSLGKGNGYLNLGIRWSVGEGYTLGLNLRDMLENKKINSNKADRGLFVEYIKGIF